MASPVRCVAVAAALLAASPGARADGLSLTLEPGLTFTSQETRDQLGTTTRLESRSLGQTYRLGFDRAIGAALSTSVGAQLQERQTRQGVDSRWTTLETTERTAYARLTLSLPVLSGGLTYDLGDRSATSALPLVREDLAGYLSWRPIDLPEVSLRATRTHHYDDTRAVQDQTTTGLLLSVRHQDGPVNARYVLLWTQPSDAITRTETRTVDQVAQGTYSGRFLEDRTVAYASLTLRNQVATTLTAGSGNLSVQQHPIAGLSLIEQFPVQTATATLAPNPALVDGELTTGAAIDLGYALAVAGDQDRRDLGVQFSDVLTGVNRIQVWVDRRLPPEVVAAYAWTAWQSDDDRSWSPVPITGPVTFGAFQNQFEIPIQETRARYLKVVTQPLRAGVTTDPAFASVLVTELQVFLVTAASAVPREQASSGALLSATATTLLWRAANLAWDLSGSLERRLSPTATVWSVLNGLAGSQELGRGLQLSERLSRQDGDFGIGRVGQTDWSAGLLWRPLPTLSGSLVYSGQYVDARPVLDLLSGRFVSQPGALTNTLASLARADLYEGVSTQLNASTGLVNDPGGKDTWNGSLNATASLTPNPWVSLTLGWLSSASTVSAADGSAVTTTSARVDASASVRPTSAISASGTLSRSVTGPSRSTSGTTQLNYSPLRGDVQVGLAYSRSFDTAAQSTTELFTPGLRWNVRPGVQLTATYTLLNTTAPVSQARSRSLSLGLSIIL
jgi:hypothetical protein